MANFNFLNLTESVRNKMIAEITSDDKAGKLFKSKRLNSQGSVNYKSILIQAATESTEVEFEQNLAGMFNEYETVNGKERKVAKNAAQLLTQSEFNRFYIRAICLESIEKGIKNVEIYRARQSNRARPESDAKIGKMIDAVQLLNDLRTNIGKQLENLPDINSGLSVKLSE